MRTNLSTFTRCRLPAPSCGSVSPGPAAAGRGCPAPARSRGPAQLSGDIVTRSLLSASHLTLSPVVTVCSLWAMVSTVQPLNSVRRVSWIHRLVICNKCRLCRCYLDTRVCVAVHGGRGLVQH